MKTLVAFAVILMFCSASAPVAKASSIVEDFSSTSNRFLSGTTLTWNIGLGQIHPPLTILNWKPVPLAVRSTSLDFGDGRHGIFDETTYRNFDSDGNYTDNIITLNTNDYPSLQVTDFVLASGYTLAPTGPLIIRSLKDVQILGATTVIECSGVNGESTKNPESQVSLGGTGRCGGGNGGHGGSHTGLAFVASEKGYPQTGATPLGGNGGADGTFGGGGGGTYYDISQPGNGNNAAGVAVAGTRGTTVDEQEFSVLLGSSGGGGGGAFYAGAPADPTSSSGGGGGGGGGVVVIYALRDFYNAGSIKAQGGNGGGVGGVGQLGGLGGGGGAGTVIIVAGRNYQNDGTVNVDPGAAATRAGNAGNGGIGGPGRGWFTDNDGVLTGTGSESISCILQQCGTSGYDIGTLVAETISFDLQNTRPHLESLALVSSAGGGSTVSVEVAGSRDNFASDTSGWLSSSQLSTFANYRYIKFRFQINNQSATSPAYIDTMTLNYTETNQDNFVFSSGCGRIETGQPFKFDIARFLFSFFAMLLPFCLLRLRRKIQFSV